MHIKLLSPEAVFSYKCTKWTRWEFTALTQTSSWIKGSLRLREGDERGGMGRLERVRERRRYIVRHIYTLKSEEYPLLSLPSLYPLL